MSVTGPIVVGGNGHSGTRVFSEILNLGGVSTGIMHLTKRKSSEDLRIIDLLDRWVSPYVYGTLSREDMDRMKKAFSRRLRLYFPLRGRPWGFKNPRTMLILPFLDELLPNTRFIHVIRDGRDISLGNLFVTSNRYLDAFLADEEKQLPPEEKMILFWGRSNQRAMEYGTKHMAGRYLMMRLEDLCTDAISRSAELLGFASSPVSRAEEAARFVKKPKSIGRWKTFPDVMQERVNSRGSSWLRLFGYL
jgi:hypothetical protein